MKKLKDLTSIPMVAAKLEKVICPYEGCSRRGYYKDICYTQGMYWDCPKFDIYFEGLSKSQQTELLKEED